MNKNKYKKPIYAIIEDSNDSNSNNSDNLGKQKQLWCICRSDDGARFMICCDSCEEWYHGDCVNITPKQSEFISKYFCAQCQKRNPLLKIQYKPGFVKKSKDLPSKVDKAFKLKTEDKLIDQPKFDKIYKSKFDDKQIDSMQSKADRPFKIKSEDKLNESSSGIVSKYDKPYKSKFEERLNEPVMSKYDKPYKSKFDDRPMIFESPQSKFERQNKIKCEEKLDRLESIGHSKIDKAFKLKPQDRPPYEQILKESSANVKSDRPTKMKTEEKSVEPIIKFTQKPAKQGSCGECMGCLRKVDCNFCPNCRMKSDKGCLKRVCQFLRPNTEKIAKPEKVMLTKLPGEFIPMKTAVQKKPPVRPVPFSKTHQTHSSSPSSNENQTKSLKRPLSPSTSSESDSSSIISNRLKPTAAGPATATTTVGFSKQPPPKQLKLESVVESAAAHKMSKGKFTESSCSSDDNRNRGAVEEEEIEDDDMDDESNDESDDSNEESSGSFVPRKMVKPNKITQRPATKKLTHNSYHGRDDARSVSPRSKSKFPTRNTQPRMIDNMKQHKSLECHNIGCNKPNRLGSKYCSDDCGVALAEQRLLKYLPSRITNWNSTPSICNQRDRRTQAEIQEECETIHYNLNILDKSHHDLIEFIDRWRSSCTASVSTDDDDRRPPGANDDSVQCVTCGYMVGSTKALAHMENCYQKIEGGTMVFADFEEQPIGSKLFCDFYDNNIRGYCKRLAALCDHNKDSKVDPKTICAFPLSVNEKSSKVCMTAKIKCNRHVNWERIQRAVIDMNRYRLLVRYEELQVEDRKFKHNIAQRGGVMSLLLHETIDHQPLKPLLPMKTKDRNKKMRKFTKAMCI